MTKEHKTLLVGQVWTFDKAPVVVIELSDGYTESQNES